MQKALILAANSTFVLFFLVYPATFPAFWHGLYRA